MDQGTYIINITKLHLALILGRRMIRSRIGNKCVGILENNSFNLTAMARFP